MERLHTEQAQQQSQEGWEAWEACPRDGPAVFVVDTAAFDQGVIRGRWIDPTNEPGLVTGQLTELLGREPDAGSWAIIDQQGLGTVMAPETMHVSELRPTADELLGGEGQV